MFDANAVKALQDSATTQILKVSGEPGHVYYLSDPKDGRSERFEALPAVRKLNFFTIDDICEAAALFGNDNSVALCGNAAIYVSIDELGDRRGGLHMDLPHTEQFRVLAERTLCSLDQNEFVRVLANDLFGCVNKCDIDIIRNLKFGQKVEGAAKASTSSSSINRSVVKDVTSGGSEIPESITVNTSVYEHLPSLVANIECAIVTDLDDITFALKPCAGQLVVASQAADTEVAAQLREKMPKGMRVFCGARES